MSFGIHYSDMCTVKELKEPIVKQAEIEYNKDFINTKDTLNYLDSRIKECINIIAETQRDIKDEEDEGNIYMR